MTIRTLAASLVLLAMAATAQANGAAAAPADSAKAAQAASAPAAAATTAAAAPAEADKMICKSERPMGSLIPKRICKTAAQWDAEREQSRKMLQDMQQRTGSTGAR
jgi:hypothetical protein